MRRPPNQYALTEEGQFFALEMLVAAQDDRAETVRLQTFGFGWLFDVVPGTHVPAWKLPVPVEVPQR